MVQIDVSTFANYSFVSLKKHNMYVVQCFGTFFFFFYPTFWLQEQLYITELLYRSFLNLMKDIDLISKNKCFVICWLSFTEVFSLFPSVVVMLAFEWGKTQMTKINT